MFKNTPLYSIFTNKCPKCHQGDFFVDNKIYNLKTFVKMHNTCKHCNEAFNKEVGFYYGAMYVSYGVNIAYGVALFLLTTIILKLNVIVFLIAFALLILVLFPWTMRISRLIYINLFVKFDKSIK